MLQLVAPALRGPVPFTAGDFIEGLSFMDLIVRRAVLFGMEQRLGVEKTVSMTHTRVMQLELTPMAQEIIKSQPRHFRLDYLFWEELPDGIVSPILDLDHQIRYSFGGMTWDDLANAYQRMVWIDDQLEAEHFFMVARQEGLMWMS